MNAFDITDFISKEMKEYQHQHADYIKIKAYYGFQGKRSHKEMVEEKLDIKSPHPTELPMPSEKILNKN
jgi:hypothetical protein